MTSGAFLQAAGLSKSYGAVDAVRDVSFDLFVGELVAMVGDNGAGKSTLAKIIAGAVRPDAGSVVVDGKPLAFGNPEAALHAGINTVYQDLALVPNLDVTCNVFLGRERVRRILGVSFLQNDTMRREASNHLTELEVNVPAVSGRIVGSMSGGQRQAIAVARSAYWARRLLILDEPTAALGVRDSQAVLALLRRLRDQGIAILMISHILPHVMDLADRALVMRHGELVADLRGDIDTEHLVALIVGYA